jgi:hypothetical protein
LNVLEPVAVLVLSQSGKKPDRAGPLNTNQNNICGH